MLLKTRFIQYNSQDLIDTELEKEVVTLLLINGEKFEQYKNLLAPQVFFHERHQKIILAMNSLIQENKDIDYLTVLNKDKEMTSSYLSDLMVSQTKSFWNDPLLTGKHLESHLRILNELKIKRDIYSKVIAGEKADEVLSDIEKLTATGLDKYLNPQEVIIEMIKTLEAKKINHRGIPYPLTILNKATNGIQDSQLIIVAGRPSAGKSSFLQNIAVSASKIGEKVTFATAEMSSEMTGLRLLSQLTGKNLFYESDFDNLSVAEELTKANISIYQFSSMSELSQKVKEHRAEMDLLIVDYLQVIEPKGVYRSLYEKLTHVINELVSLKVKFNLPIVVASQYNRQAENQQPTMADLRESGAIEQAADIIISLWRFKDDPSDLDKKRVKIDLLKNRNGRTFQNTKTQDYAIWFNNQRFEFYEETLAPPF